MAASFTGAYFSRDTTDNTSLYLTLYGGSDIPAESSYDSSKTSMTSQFKFSYPSSVTDPTFEGIRNSIYSGQWSWNADRTEVTIPMRYDLITADNVDDGYINHSSGGDAIIMDWYPHPDNNTSNHDDWKQVDKMAAGHFVQYAEDGISVGFFDSNNQQVDSWTSWNSNNASPNTFDGGNMQIFNSPAGTSERKNVYDTSGFDYSDISAYSSSGGATGDPHITTFNGKKYTL